MKKKMIDEGMTLVEVMIALTIIVGIVMIAYQYHTTMVVSNHELLQHQENFVFDENEFDQNYSEEH